jgi:hypothetical protein
MGATVVRVARTATPGENPECCCCGRRVAAKRTLLQLRDGDLLYGVLCPECVLQGPKGAARRLKDRLMEMAGRPSCPSGCRGTEIDSFQKLLARKVAALEDAESFPLEARQAAVRELREKR